VVVVVVGSPEEFEEFEDSGDLRGPLAAHWDPQDGVLVQEAPAPGAVVEVEAVATAVVVDVALAVELEETVERGCVPDHDQYLVQGRVQWGEHLVLVQVGAFDDL